jgi:hypothetical protein
MAIYQANLLGTLKFREHSVEFTDQDTQELVSYIKHRLAGNMVADIPEASNECVVLKQMKSQGVTQVKRPTKEFPPFKIPTV